MSEWEHYRRKTSFNNRNYTKKYLLFQKCILLNTTCNCDLMSEILANEIRKESCKRQVLYYLNLMSGLKVNNVSRKYFITKCIDLYNLQF
jgi:hypothetical protein